MLSAADMMIHRDAILDGLYGNVAKPDEWREDIICVNTAKDDIDRFYTYSCENGYEAAAGYAEFLRSENMTEEETGNEAFCFYRAASYGGEDGYVKVLIEPAEDGMTVTFSLTDEIGE